MTWRWMKGLLLGAVVVVGACGGDDASVQEDSGVAESASGSAPSTTIS